MVVPKAIQLEKEDAIRLMAQALGRLVSTGVTVQQIAKAAGCCAKVISNSIAGKSLIELQFALNIMAQYPNAGDELFAAYGLRVVPLTADPANDMQAVVKGSKLVSTYAECIADGNRDHRDTLRIADEARPFVALVQPIIEEADRIRGRA